MNPGPRPAGRRFPGMRSGARYRVILKDCSLSLAGSGCGPWSPDVFIMTLLPNQAAGGPPPGAASPRHNLFRIKLQADDGSDLFTQDANWRQVPPR